MKHSVVSLSRKLKFYQLAVFDQIVESGSFIRAAAALNLTQPSVTKIVQELEYYFKAPLLHRGNRGVTVTELGDLVSRRLRPILADLRKLNDDVEAYHRGTSGYLLIGTLNSASVSIIPRALDILGQRAPGLTVSVRQGQASHLLSELKAGELDMVIGRIPDDGRWHPDAGELTVAPLYREEFCVVAGVGHELRETGADAWKQMHQYPWLLPTRDSSFRHVADGLFARVGMPAPLTVVESTALLTSISLLQNNRTLALMVKGVAAPFVRGGMLKIIDIGEALDYGEIGCFFAAGREPSPALRMLLDCLHESARPVGVRDSIVFESSVSQHAAEHALA